MTDTYCPYCGEELSAPLGAAWCQECDVPVADYELAEDEDEEA